MDLRLTHSVVFFGGLDRLLEWKVPYVPCSNMLSTEELRTRARNFQKENPCWDYRQRIVDGDLKRPWRNGSGSVKFGRARLETTWRFEIYRIISRFTWGLEFQRRMHSSVPERKSSSFFCLFSLPFLSEVSTRLLNRQKERNLELKSI